MEKEEFEKKRKITYKDFFNTYSLVYLICGVVLSTLFMLLPYSIMNRETYGLINGTFLGGTMSLGIGLLFWAANEGTFDVISLGFSDLVNTIKRNGTRKYESLFDYREQHKEIRRSKRFSWLAFEVIGIIFLIISVSLYFYYY